jgi:hypothetical protein
VPISEIPTYGGPSSYLLMTKYNNYAETGGDGLKKIAVLDHSRAPLCRWAMVFSINEWASRIASPFVAAAPIVPPPPCGSTTSQNQHWRFSQTLKPISK